jgi:two-component system phosphate regulon sensor histidine kinase PhoR
LEENCLGRYVLEVFRSSQMDRLLQQVLYRDAVAAVEMTADPPEEHILRIHGAPIKEDGETVGAVVLVQDITELRRLEQVRTDFVANVSHELKTPLTSIMGFVETLKEGAVDQPDTARRFLDIIQIETERLARLINDILSLSELESKKSQRFHARINMAEMVRETLEMMKTYARSKTISLGHLFSNQDIFLHGSPDRIKQMVINLVDNAIKYTPNGGSVTVLLEDLPEKVVLRVRDTGIGIAKEHIPRLFERFYRVDKGRSRNLGGTGLGLAIVKHIVLSMKGEIQVSSEPGKGTEFSIVLPKQ